MISYWENSVLWSHMQSPQKEQCEKMPVLNVFLTAASAVLWVSWMYSLSLLLYAGCTSHSYAPRSNKYSRIFWDFPVFLQESHWCRIDEDSHTSMQRMLQRRILIGVQAGWVFPTAIHSGRLTFLSYGLAPSNLAFTDSNEKFSSAFSENWIEAWRTHANSLAFHERIYS